MSAIEDGTTPDPERAEAHRRQIAGSPDLSERATAREAGCIGARGKELRQVRADSAPERVRDEEIERERPPPGWVDRWHVGQCVVGRRRFAGGALARVILITERTPGGT